MWTRCTSSSSAPDSSTSAPVCSTHATHSACVMSATASPPEACGASAPLETSVIECSSLPTVTSFGFPRSSRNRIVRIASSSACVYAACSAPFRGSL